LRTVGYYRLMSYFKPFLMEPKDSEQGFKTGTNFSDILQLYTFDRKLRLLVTDALERIEIALRSSISNVMSIKYGSHWYLDGKLFVNQASHDGFMIEIKKHLKQTKEDFIQSYYKNYDSPEHPPSWMIIECLPFGAISKLYSGITDRSARKQIGDIFGQYSEVLKSWMKSLTYTRNLCAHHARLWNRFFINKPKDIHIDLPIIENSSPFILQAYIIIKLLNKVAPDNQWKEDLFSLFNNCSGVSFSAMGYGAEWKKDPIWDL